MKKNNINYVLKLLLAHVFLWAVAIITGILMSKAETSNVYIRDLPNVDRSFFNNFIVNGENIYFSANLSLKGTFFTLFSNNPKIEWKLFSIFSLTLFGTAVCPLFELGFLDFGRWWFVLTSYINLILMVALLGNFLSPLSSEAFYKTFDNQINQIFGEDFFNTSELQNQLQILKGDIANNFKASSYIALNICGIISSIAAFGSIIWWLISDHKFFSGNKSKENKEQKTQDMESEA